MADIRPKDLATTAESPATDDYLLLDGTTEGTRRMLGRALETVSVKRFGAVGDGTTDDAPAFQAAVDAAIALGTNRIFVPFGNRERYLLGATVTIAAATFEIAGDATPRYVVEDGGYIFAGAGVTTLVNFGNAGVYAADNFVVEGVAFYSTTGYTQTAVKHSQANNGPSRGVLFRKVSGAGFLNVVAIDVPNPAFISAGTVVFDACVMHNNGYSVNASSGRVFGLRFVGNQSEQGARITGAFDGPVTIEDNMLEGQANPINIDSASPMVEIRNNYLEAISGDYVVRFKSTADQGAITIHQNYITALTATDIYRIESVVRVIEKTPTTTNGRKAVLTFPGTVLRAGSSFLGDFYCATQGYAMGFTNPSPLGPVPTGGVVSKALGSVTLKTPFGETTTGITVNGFPATYYTLTKTYAATDIVVAAALVRVEGAEIPYFRVYNQAVTETDLIAGALAVRPEDNEKWFILFIVAPPSIAGTELRFRFGSNETEAGSTNLHVAAIGATVIPVSEAVTFNSVERVFCRLFNPFL